MKIGYRTIKTAIATPIAVIISQLLGISNIVSAGILTILCIQPSRKKSVITAWERLAACLLAIFFSVVFFELLSYSPIVLGFLFLVFIPVTVFFKIDSGILTGAVIILNTFHFGMINTAFIFEQLALIIIGIGTGLVVNLYMPSLDKQLQQMQWQLEEQFKAIFQELALYLKENKLDWDGAEITDIENIFEEAETLVARDKGNHILKDTHLYEQYFNMRKRQFSLIKQMLPVVTQLPPEDPLTNEIADFFMNLSDAIHPGDTSIIYLQQVAELQAKFNEKPLPETQVQFKQRASLLQLLFLLENYLEHKSKYYKENPPKKRKRGILQST